MSKWIRYRIADLVEATPGWIRRWYYWRTLGRQ
jgi:hypothetical protein